MQTLPASEADLRKILHQRVEELDRIVPLPRPADPDLKWRYVSCLQKSVRRGHWQSALIAADALLAVDPRYCWRRLKVIALEDVGLAAPVECALVLQAVRDSNFRRKLGERRCLAALVDGLATAVKDRSLTHLLLLNHNRPPPPPMWAKYVDSLELPWLIAYLAKRGRSAEKLGVQVPLLYDRMPSETEVITLPPDPYGDEIIAGLPACAFDQHTSEGKRSIAYFTVACNAVREFYERNRIDKLKTAGIALFFLEGRVLDRKLEWAGRTELCAESRVFTCMFRGFETVEQIDELTQIISENRAQLNDVRRRIVL